MFLFWKDCKIKLSSHFLLSFHSHSEDTILANNDFLSSFRWWCEASGDALRLASSKVYHWNITMSGIWIKSKTSGERTSQETKRNICQCFTITRWIKLFWKHLPNYFFKGSLAGGSYFPDLSSLTVFIAFSRSHDCLLKSQVVALLNCILFFLVSPSFHCLHSRMLYNYSST